MGYISVKDAAKRFGISERRVQKLCETNRIKNCQMVSGVWIIPDDAKKPNDERLSEVFEQKDIMSLKELCDELAISTATGRNWIKLEKIQPEYTDKRTPYFTKQYVKKLKKDIQSGTNGALKSRRNKKYVTGSALYNSYVSENCSSVGEIQRLLEIIHENNIKLNEDTLQVLIADCALKLYLQKKGLVYNQDEDVLYKYLEGEFDIGEYKRLLDDLLSDSEKAKKWILGNRELFQIRYKYEENEDILGLLYISCKNIGNRKATGSYYTPTKVVRKLIQKVVEKNGTDDTVLDPCCGTGNFLLQLPANFTIDQIYGNDIDSISVKITRINLLLKFMDVDIDKICNHITTRNYLSEYGDKKFGLIIGNPPWGYSFDTEELDYLRKNYESANGNKIESYDMFIERAFMSLKRNGVLSFVLPEAILNVKSHMLIRKMIAEKNSIQYIEFLGNAFDKVQCPCIILQIKHTKEKMNCVGMEVNDGNCNFYIDIQRKIDPEIFSFTLNDDEYQIIRKVNEIPNAAFLENNAIFALGIVTGNNKEYISNKKTKSNEMILKGADLCKYKAKPSQNYIVFAPDTFQQIAPTEYYRAPEKLLYRFISSQLVFAYDDKQTLSLNSCNILIPQIEGLEIKYVLAILNSRVAQFIYKKQFNSVKVLRSHIEQIPIPRISKEQQSIIIEYVDNLMGELTESEIYSVYDLLDEEIRKLYGISDEEYFIIKESVDKENKFLT